MADDTVSSRGSVDGGYGEELEPCTTCCEPIRKYATKCIHCDSYQDWRRFLTSSSAVLAAVLSLVAIAVASIPVVHQAWRKADSELRVVSAPELQSGHLFITVANEGKKACTVDIVTMLLPIKRSQRTIWLHLMRRGANSGVVEGDSLRELDYAAEYPATHVVGTAWNPGSMTKEDLLADKAQLIGSCPISLRTTSYRGKTQDLSTNLDCILVRELIQQYWDDAHRVDHK